MLEIHIDPLGGIAGDMFVAALIDLRPDLEPGLKRVLASTPLIEDITCDVAPHSDGILAGRRFLVRRQAHGGSADGGTAHYHHAHGHHNHTAWKQIRSALELAPLDETTRRHAIDIFSRLAEAEGRVHSTSPDEVHFHEVGAWDSIADIVGAAWLISQLDAARWTIGPLPLGGGRIPTAHGLLAVPAPATALLLQGFATIDDGIPGERVTPTGAAIVRHLCDLQAPLHRARRLVGSGHGFGTRPLPGISNCVRLLAFAADEPRAQTLDRIVVLECEIDDQSGEDLGLAIENLRALDGVVDVVQAPVFGKKGRMMTHLRVLAASAAEDSTVRAIFSETTTLGLRRSMVDRYILNREETTSMVDGRPVRIKIADRPAGRTAKVEADDLADISGSRARKRVRRRGEASFEEKDQD